MPYISRAVGTVSSLITLFLNDRTVSTGAGLANIVASTVRMSWLRSDQAAVSSWTLTTGTLGTWAASTMTQVGSTSTLGAYQFSLPNGLFASGDNAYVHIMSSTAAFAEVPIVIELTKTDNQTYLSSQSVSSVINQVGLIARGTISTATASSVRIEGALFTSANPEGSMIYIKGGLGSSQARRVRSWALATSTAFVSPDWAETPNSTSIFEWTAGFPYPTQSGSRPQVDVVSSVQVGVSTLTVAAMSSFFTLDAGDYSTSVLGSVVQEIADNVSATVGAQVGVSSISIPVGVSTITAGVLSTHSVSSVLNEGGVIHRGTAVSSTASTIQLDATLSTYPNDNPTGSIVFIKSGPGAGQSRVVEDWTSTGSVAAIAPNWTVNPTSTSVYEWHAAAPGTNSTFPLVTLASTQILVGVSTLPAISSISTPVTASSVTAGVNVTSLIGSPWVTSAAGVPGPLRVSSISTPVSASSVTAPVGISTITVAAMSSFFTLDAGDYSTSVLGSVVQEIADNVSATVGAQVGVSSISIPVGVSTITAGVLSTHSVSSVLNESGIIHKGTAVSSTASTIQLAVTLSTYADNLPNGSIVYIKSGPGAGQSRMVDDWSSSGSIAAISPNWETNPTSTSVYEWHAGAPGSTSSTPLVTVASTMILFGTSTVTTPVTASSVTAPVGISTITVAAMSSFFTLDAGDYSTSVLGSVVQEIADNVSATVGAQVGVSSISIPVSVSSVTAAVNVSAIHGSPWVTSAAGVPGPLRVSSISTPVTASSVTGDVNVTSVFGSAFVTSAAGVLGPLRVSSISTPVTASSVTAGVNVSSLIGSPWVTSAAGVPGPLSVSTVSTPVTASSVTAGVNVSSLVGSPWVTSAAGVPGPLRVSSISTPVSASSVTAPVGVSTLTVAAVSTFFTLDAGDYSTSVLGSVVQEIANNVSATVGAQVGVSSISIPVSVSSVSVTVSANIVKVRNTDVTGSGTEGDPWGP